MIEDSPAVKDLLDKVGDVLPQFRGLDPTKEGMLAEIDRLLAQLRGYARTSDLKPFVFPHTEGSNVGIGVYLTDKVLLRMRGGQGAAEARRKGTVQPRRIPPWKD